MSEYVTQEVQKIMDDSNLEFPKNMAMASAWIIGNFKGISLKVLNMSKLSSLADYYVIGTATNIVQANAMISSISREFKKLGYNVLSKEGTTDKDWVLIDLGDVLVHIFQDHSRELYDVDNLWIEADKIDIPNEYYHTDPEEHLADDSSGDGYF